MSECDKIILRLTRKLAELQKDSKTNNLTLEHFSSDDAVANLTGLHIKAIKEIDEKGASVDLKVLDRSMVYTALCHFYLRYKKNGETAPTTYQLFNAMVKHDLILKIDIARFRKLLVKMGFIWKKVDWQRLVVIERPSIRFERLNYLMQMKRCRVERYDDIYFVDEFAFNQGMIMDIDTSRDFEKETGLWQVRRIHAVGTKAIICMKEVNNFNAETYQEWVDDILIPILAVPSVIVVKDIPHHNAKLLETPTLFSSRTDMMKWLDYFDVPYDPDMSKYELFSLAEDLTDLDTHLYKVDEILKGHGHKLLRIPNCLGDNLNPASLLFKQLESNEKLHSDNITDLDKSMVKLRFEKFLFKAVSSLQRFSHSVIYHERKMLQMEQDVDKQLDLLLMRRNLMLGTGRLEKEDSDVASCDSD